MDTMDGGAELLNSSFSDDIEKVDVEAVSNFCFNSFSDSSDCFDSFDNFIRFLLALFGFAFLLNGKLPDSIAP